MAIFTETNPLFYKRLALLERIAIKCPILSHKRSQRKLYQKYLIVELPQTIQFSEKLIGKKAEIFKIKEQNGEQITQSIEGEIRRKHGNRNKVLLKMEQGISSHDIGRNIFIKLY